MDEQRNRKQSPVPHAAAPKKLKLLVTVVDTSKADFYIDLLHSYEVNLQMQLNARGTAGSEMLHYLGLEHYPRGSRERDFEGSGRKIPYRSKREGNCLHRAAVKRGRRGNLPIFEQQPQIGKGEMRKWTIRMK